MERYLSVPKKFVVVSNTGRENFTTAFCDHITPGEKPDILFLSAAQYHKISLSGDRSHDIAGGAAGTASVYWGRIARNSHGRSVQCAALHRLSANPGTLNQEKLESSRNEAYQLTAQLVSKRTTVRHGCELLVSNAFLMSVSLPKEASLEQESQ